MASTPSPAIAVLLRPELFEFIGVQAFGRLACCSAALREDLRDAKAWQLLADTRMPRSKREAELAAERDAAARVRAYELRRRLADVASGKVQPQHFRPNKFADFTYFVRFEEDGEVIWEGDLKGSLDDRGGNFSFSLAEAWSAMKNNDSWAGMATFLTTSTDDYIDGNSDVYLQRLCITVVAMRDEDQAMVSLGQLFFDDANGGVGDPEQIYVFRSRDPVLSLDRFQLMPTAVIRATHDDVYGNGTLDSLELDLERHRLTHRQNARLCWPRQFEYVLSYLAGVHHQARDDAYETIAGWRNFSI